MANLSSKSGGATNLDKQVLETARRVQEASGQLAAIDPEKLTLALERIAATLEVMSAEIIAANNKDLEAARALVAAGQLKEALYHRLKIDASKLQSAADGVRQVAELPNLLGEVTLARELDANLTLYRISCPIGVIAVIFESRPDALIQIASLCLKSGNGVILKGGKEAERSNRMLFDIIHQAVIESGLPADCIALLESRDDVNSLLKADQYVDLVIPRGSNELVKSIQERTQIPVLGHADGVCHVYVDAGADPLKSVKIVVDSKVQYPAACNSAETLLVHSSIKDSLLPALAASLAEKKVELRCDEVAMESLKALHLPNIALASESDWATEYSDLTISIKVVDSLEEAIAHINRYGSGHTETIVSENKAHFEEFFSRVNSAGVYWNASTRFADGFRYGFGAEVGISTGKTHPRGPVGLDGLVTYKYKLMGDGHIVGDYTGPNAKKFTHKDL